MDIIRVASRHSILQWIIQQRNINYNFKACTLSIHFPSSNPASMATPLSKLNGPSQVFPTIPKPLQKRRENYRSSTVSALIGRNTQASQESQPQAPQSSGIPLQTSRRATVGLAVTTLFHQLATGASHAYEPENNGFWLTGPLPVPSVTNNIFNKETGTRSFLQKGLYIADIGPQGRAYRIRQYAFDLLALGDLLGQNAWSSVSKYLRLKSTFMYYDFDEVISAAADEQKQPLTTLAVRLFDSVEKLEDAVKKRSDPMTQSCYADTEVILKEVMTRMA